MPVDATKRAAVVGAIEKKWGKGNTYAANTAPKVARVPTGSLELDYVTGGGYPIGRFTRMYGGASSGKTLACWNAIREAQKRGMDCVYYNIEKQFDPIHVAKIGIDMDKLLVVDGTIIEEIVEKAEALMGVYHLHVFDSCSQAVPIDEINAKPTDHQVGLAPRMWAKGFRRLNKAFDDRENLVIYVDHARTVFGSGAIKPPGGKAMEHASSMTLEFKRGKWLNYDDEGILEESKGDDDTLSGDAQPEGIEMQIRCQKSRVCPPFRTARVRIGFDTYEYDTDYELLKAAKWTGVAKNGPYYEVEGYDKKVHGEGKLRKTIGDDDKLRKLIEKRMLEKLK